MSVAHAAAPSGRYLKSDPYPWPYDGDLRPDLVREARAQWGVENNIYQLGHRAFTAVAGGARDCPYTYMHDLVAGRYRLPWEDAVQVTDGTSCGFAKPTRVYGAHQAEAAE